MKEPENSFYPWFIWDNIDEKQWPEEFYISEAVAESQCVVMNARFERKKKNSTFHERKERRGIEKGYNGL